METTIPDELLELKARLDQWRATRKHVREAIPDELRNAAIEMSGKYPRKLIRRILKLDPWRLVWYQAAKQSKRKSMRIMTRKGYPSDVSDGEWALVAPYLNTDDRRCAQTGISAPRGLQ
jgi:hypothetical protein